MAFFARALLLPWLLLAVIAGAAEPAVRPVPLLPAGAGLHITGFVTAISDDDASLYLEHRDLLAGTTTESAQFPAGAGNEVGVRATLWYRSLVLGTEFSRFGSDNCCLHLDMLPVTLFAGWRLAQPVGGAGTRGLHPYVLLGVSQTMVDGDATLGTITAPIDAGPDFPATGESNLSAFMAAGVEWRLGSRMGLLLEYRRRRIDFEGLWTNSWIFPTENIIADGHLDASGATLGIVWYPAPPVQSRPVPAPDANAAHGPD